MVRLGNDEVVLLQVDDVIFHSDSKGVFDVSSHSGSLTLTNKRELSSLTLWG